MGQTDEPVELVERVAALDLGKTGLVACLRVPQEDRPGRRRQEIREYATVSRSLVELADWLRCERVELVAMESTSDYWKPVFLSSGGGGVPLLAAQFPSCEECAGPTEDRQARRCVAGQGSRTGNVYTEPGAS
jgi:hypothetical protein